MNERHVTDHLPLWIGGDLDAQGAAAVEAHLAACDACRAAAEALRESQSWLKSDASHPFTAGDRDQLRREVLARVASGPPALKRRMAWWSAAAFAAAASLLILLLHRGRTQATAEPAPLVAAVVPSKVVPAPPAPRAVRIARHHPIPPHPDPEEPAGPGASRIEMQTRNPQIRIIWLARAATPDGSPDSI